MTAEKRFPDVSLVSTWSMWYNWQMTRIFDPDHHHNHWTGRRHVLDAQWLSGDVWRVPRMLHLAIHPARSWHIDTSSWPGKRDICHELSTCNWVTTLHLGVPFMGRQQREAPLTFHMALAYFCDISSSLCNTVCCRWTCCVLRIAYFQLWYFTPQ